jgi:hypothetical protein
VTLSRKLLEKLRLKSLFPTAQLPLSGNCRILRCIQQHAISRGFGWRIHCGVKVTESSTNKQHSLYSHYYAYGHAEPVLRRRPRPPRHMRSCSYRFTTVPLSCTASSTTPGPQPMSQRGTDRRYFPISASRLSSRRLRLRLLCLRAELGKSVQVLLPPAP